MSVGVWVCCCVCAALVAWRLLGHARCRSARRLDGLTALVTGCNTGIGLVTVADLYKRGARVLMACRDAEKAAAARREVLARGDAGCGELVLYELRLDSLESVRACAARLLALEPRLDILVNNAGVMTCPPGRTADGFETHFGTNHLGHALLTLLLLPRLRRAPHARIVTVASLAHIFLLWSMLDDLNWERARYNRVVAYALSKTANIVFSRELHKQLRERGVSNVSTYSLHPGSVQTELGRHLGGVLPGLAWLYYKLGGLVLKTPEQGAQTSIYCAVDEACQNQSGLYYSECEVMKPWGHAASEDYAKEMWSKTLEMLRLDKSDPLTSVE